MADVDREALPTVEQAVAITRERQAAERTVIREAVGKKEITAPAVELTKRGPERAIAFPAPATRNRLDETALEIRRAFTASEDGNGIHAAATPNEHTQR